MPRRNNGLTRQQQVFAKAYAGHGDAQAAAIVAKYSHGKTGYHIMQNPAVASEVRKIQQRRLTNEALPAAVNCLIEIVNDKEQRGSTRVAAAKVILSQTLGDRGEAGGKEPHEMSSDELARAIKELEQAAADRAKDVTPGLDPSVFD